MMTEPIKYEMELDSWNKANPGYKVIFIHASTEIWIRLLYDGITASRVFKRKTFNDLGGEGFYEQLDYLKVTNERIRKVNERSEYKKEELYYEETYPINKKELWADGPYDREAEG